MKYHLDDLSRDPAIVTAKADAMYDRSRPGFIHALRRKEDHEGWTELTFPGGFVCSTNSSPIETELEYNEVVAMKEYLRSGISVSDGDTVIDVGANVGIFAMHLLRGVPGLTIHAIEPVPDMFEVLKSNMARYPHRPVYLHNIAIGAGVDSTLEIVLYPHLTGNATACPEVTQMQRESLSGHLTAEEIAYLYTEERVTVPCTTLSSFFRNHSIEHIDLLKIDTEGSEINILSGVEPGDWSKIEQVALEVHDEQRSLGPITALLERYGMRVTVDAASRDPSGTIVATAVRA